MKWRSNISLQLANTLGVPVCARNYVHITSQNMLQACLRNRHPGDLVILGSGSNVVFKQNFSGNVLHMGITDPVVVDKYGTKVYVTATAGMCWDDLVAYCVAHGYGGIENLTSIPGTVGAAPIQNIGAYGVELGEVFERLEAVDIHTGTTHTFHHDDCKFSYRNSVFTHDDFLNRYIITRVVLRLSTIPQMRVNYGDIQNMLIACKEPTLSDVRMAISHIRRKKLPDTNKLGNVGSFFHNPVITEDECTGLKKHNPDIITYPLPEGRVKLSAAWLIERCGWKGVRRGNVGVYEHHALILVNYGGGTGDEIIQLAYDIRDSVADRFSVILDMEPRIY